MGRDYGKVRAQFWDDDVLRELSIEANFLALYLITSRHTNAIGCFRLPIAYIINDTRLDKKSLEKALAELREAGYALPCERVPWIYIPNFLRHNAPENPNVWRKCVKELDELPGDVSAAATIAAELFDLAGDERMCRDGAKGRVSDEERAKLKRFEDRSETVSKRLLPLSLPNHSKPEPTLSAGADGVLASKTIPEDFETFWKAYAGPKNSKKPEALKAWAATAKLRPALPDLLRAAANYTAWIADETRKQKREYPKQHHSTWLRGEMWNNYGDGGAAFSPEEIEANKDRADRIMRRGKYSNGMGSA